MNEENQVEYNTPPVNQIKSARTFGFFDRSKKPIWISAITGAIVITGLLIYILFFKHEIKNQDITGDILLGVTAPTESRSGSEVSYLITYQNLTNVKLTNINLEIFYPSGFSFVDATPDMDDKSFSEREGPRDFKIADLPVGASGKIIIVGALSGTVRESKSFSVKLHYVPENFRSSFLAEASVISTMLAPNLDLLISAPAQVITGSDVTYQARLINISEVAFDNLVLKLDYPLGFEFKTATREPAKLSDNREWNFPSLNPGQEISFEITGILNHEAGNEAVVFAELSIKKNSSIETINRTLAITEIRPTPLVLSQSILGNPQNLDLGQLLKYDITYENNSLTSLRDVTVTLNFDSDVFDLQTLVSDNGQLQTSANSNALVFTPAFIPALRNVAPGHAGKFSFSIKLKTSLPSSVVGPVARSSLSFKAVELSKYVVSEVLEKKIRTQMYLDARLIPVSPTIYRVEILATNTVNDSLDTEVSLNIPRADVIVREGTMGPEEELGGVTYRSATGIITWNLGRVFAFTGRFHSARVLSFEVQVNADDSRGVLILEDLRGSGKDQWTGEKIEVQGDNVKL